MACSKQASDRGYCSIVVVARSLARSYVQHLSHVVVIDADIYACMHARIIPHPHIIFKISRRVHIQRNDKRNIIELAITYMMHVCLLA
jgi:hypothetical protein